MSKNITKEYTVINIITPSISSDKALQLMSANLILKDNEQIKHQHISIRNFAYKIFKHTSGHYVVTNIEASAETVRNLINKMRLNENFLRTMVLKGFSFSLDDVSEKKLSSHTTKRGRILFQSSRLNRKTKKITSMQIKRARILGMLPFCNYNA